MFVASLTPKLEYNPFSSFLPCNINSNHRCNSRLNFQFPSQPKQTNNSNHFTCFASLENSNSVPEHNNTHNPPKVNDKSPERIFPSTIPKKPKRGRKSEASAVEDLLRGTLERTFASIREQNPDILKDKENIIKEQVDEDKDEETLKSEMVVEEESPDWPPDADVGWGIRASEYFDKHAIKNVVGEDGIEIDWEGEIDDNWVKEIDCLEWERFAFHPSPLIVLVFERYNRASKNWKVLKELEKAVQVYLGAKHLLPPRTVKIDMNIERDLAYALKVKDCPQILFLRGHKILYREKEIRTADELVQAIAYFYFKAKKPPHIKEETLSRPF